MTEQKHDFVIDDIPTLRDWVKQTAKEKKIPRSEMGLHITGIVMMDDSRRYFFVISRKGNDVAAVPATFNVVEQYTEYERKKSRQSIH